MRDIPAAHSGFAAISIMAAMSFFMVDFAADELVDDIGGRLLNAAISDRVVFVVVQPQLQPIVPAAKTQAQLGA